MMKPSDDVKSSVTPQEIDQFRENWQRELMLNLPQVTTNNNAVTNPEEQENIAETLFHRAVELEKCGKVYDALPFYKKAVQIIPDIEMRFYERQKMNSTTAISTGEEDSLHNESLEYYNGLDLYEKFKTDLAQSGKLFFSNDAAVISTRKHISELPPEILFYILRWVISNQLDIVSLENCARVSKGMYLYARDEELWRSACVKVWGVNVGTPDQPGCKKDEFLSKFKSWRHMFIERTRVLFNGCYISKTTYLRMGENSFQDQYYRPIQLVEYFRYIRFYPDGTMAMMTSADEPVIGVTKLRNIHQSRSDVLRGQYCFNENIISCSLKKQQPQRLVRQRRGSSSAYMEDFGSVKYYIEFKVLSTPKRKFSQLIWLHYSVTQIRNKIETSSIFEITSSKYPTMWFSPVRSYHLLSDAPLI